MLLHLNQDLQEARESSCEKAHQGLAIGMEDTGQRLEVEGLG